MTQLIPIGLFALSGGIFAVLAVLARRENSKIPTFGEITGFIMQYEVAGVPVGRVAVLGLWWWTGWHFFAR